MFARNRASGFAPKVPFQRRPFEGKGRSSFGDRQGRRQQDWVFKHEEFAARVDAEFHHLCMNHNSNMNPVTKLLLCKEAIKNVHDNIVGSQSIVDATSLEDKLGWAIMCAKHLEQFRFDQV